MQRSGQELTAGEEAVLREHGDGVDEQDGHCWRLARAEGWRRGRGHTVEEAAEAEEQHGGDGDEMGSVQGGAKWPLQRGRER